MSAKKILVVDDHAPTRLLIRAILLAETAPSYQVVEAATGAECLREFDKGTPFDLILLDVVLPDMDGFAVCEAIRRQDDRVPILFVTGKTDLKDYTAGRNAGGDSYVVKPIARGALRAIVTLFTSVERKGAAREALTET